MDWKTISRCDIYEVSSCGRVRRAGGKEKARTVAVNGYLVVNLWKNNKGTVYHVHDLVAEAFIGPRPVGHHVNHIDADRTNPAASNLEYVTPAENMRHCKRLGRHAHGARSGGAKLTDELSRQIHRRANNGERTRDLAAEYGVSEPTICGIKYAYRWKHLHAESLE